MKLGPLRISVEKPLPEPVPFVDELDGLAARLELAEPSFRRDACPECGCEHFAAGGPVTQHESNGERSRVRQESAVLSCLGCGARWFGTKDGLRKPHEAALPPAWAMMDLQARVQKAQHEASEAQRERQREAKQRPAPRGPHAGFRTPPPPPPD